MRTMTIATTVLLLSCGKAAAGQILGSIRKIEDGKITVVKIDKNQNNKPMILKVAAGVKANQFKINVAQRKMEVSKPFPNGLKDKAFDKVKGKSGLAARITTNDDGEVTEVTLMPAGFKIRVSPKKKDKDK